MSRNRVVLILLIAAVVSALPLAAGAQGPGSEATANIQPGRTIADGAFAQSIGGRAFDMQGIPAANARVDLTTLSTGQQVSSTYTSESGQFVFENVPAGSYEVVVTKGLNQARERVTVESTMAPQSVTLRLPTDASEAAADTGSKYAVSVAQMQVPKKARKTLDKARKAMEQGKTEEANKYVAEALSLAPAFADALTMRGVLELDGKQPEKARADMEKAVQLDPGSGMNLIALGATYNVLQRFDDALRVVRQGMSMAPTAWQGYFEMGKAYIGKGRYMDALKQLGKASDLAPRNFAPLHLVKAHVYLSLKNYDQSMNELQQYLEQDPHGPESDGVRSALQQVRAFTAVAPGGKK